MTFRLSRSVEIMRLRLALTMIEGWGERGVDDHASLYILEKTHHRVAYGSVIFNP